MQNSRFSVKPCQVVPHARARVRQIRFFDQPYNPRKQKQFCASGGKAVKLGLANMLQVGFTGLLALAPIRGQWTDAGRSALGLAMDWQAWGTKGGLCWRATRDGLRHVPASPPKPGAPKGILCNPPNQGKQLHALTSPTWARGRCRVLREIACPRGAKNPET